MRHKKLKLLGNAERGLLFVLSAPAGTGKTTLVNMLAEEFPCVVPSLSFTTRHPRSGEKHGEHYHFISVEEFDQKVVENEFLEYVQLYGHFYGTSKKWVEEQLSIGKHVVLVIDTQGALQLMGKVPLCSIFLMPPSPDELRRRLKGRKTESESIIEERLEWANQELERCRYYDYCIINDDLNTAYQVLKSILIAEEHKVIIKE